MRPESHEAHPATVHRGLRGWLERKAKGLKTSWAHAEHGVAGKLHRCWDWLQNKIPNDEPMLVHLRTARSLEIHHPAVLSGEEVRVCWQAYLKSRRNRH